MCADEIEPTPRVGPCLEDLGIVEEIDARMAHAMLVNKEYNIVDILLYNDDVLEVYIEVFIGLECLHVLSLHARSCVKEGIEKLKALSEKPEFTRIVLEGDCFEIQAPWEPPFRLKRALDLLGIKGKTSILGYRAVDKFVIE